MAGHAGTWASAMKMSKHRCFLEKPTRKFLDRCFANGRRLTEEDILIYNSFISKRGWHDDESDASLLEIVRKFGLRDGSVPTYFDLIEMDEGRWYPDMWRDAWREHENV